MREQEDSRKRAGREAKATHTAPQKPCSPKKREMHEGVQSWRQAGVVLCWRDPPPTTNHRLGVEQGFSCGPPTLQGYLSYIKGLPLNDMPEIFGLHDNANITFAQNETYALLGAIIQLQPRSSSMGGQGREEVGGCRGQRAMGWAGSVSHRLSCLLLCGKEPSAYGIRQELSKGCWP